MTLMAFDPARLDALRAALGRSIDDLDRLRCPDAVAATATETVRRARRLLTTVWQPKIDRLRTSTVLTHYTPVAHGATFDLVEDGRVPTVPLFGVLGMDVPEGAQVQSFTIPRWPGQGTTRIQFFIDDEEVCLSGTGPDIACGHGDDRDVAGGQAITDYELPCRVRIVLDHEAGAAMVVSYPTHGDDGDQAALPIELTVDGPVELPDDYPSQLRVWTHGDGIDGNIVFDYRFLNSVTPAVVGGIAPAINGAIRVRQAGEGEDGDLEVELDGRLATYPTVEVMRDRPIPNGYRSTEIYVDPQDSGGPLNLYEPGEPFAAQG